MLVARRHFLRSVGASLAVSAFAPTSHLQAEATWVATEPLNIKREEVQQSADVKWAVFGEPAEDQDGNQIGRALSWRIKGGGPRDIAWQLAQVGVGVFRRPSPSVPPILKLLPMDVTFRCTIWSRGYESTTATKGGCFLEIVLLNKDGLTLNHQPLELIGFDIRCQFRGNNLILPSLPYTPVDNAVFDQISHIQLFDRGGSAHPDTRYVCASACSARAAPGESQDQNVCSKP